MPKSSEHAIECRCRYLSDKIAASPSNYTPTFITSSFTISFGERLLEP